MLSKVDTRKSISFNQQQENVDEKLWQKLKINFHLDAPVASDNTITGTIDIEPAEARELIKNFVLVVNDSTRIKFNCNLRKISVSGLDPIRIKSSVFIEAEPKNQELMPRQSEHHSFLITRQSLSLTPAITFIWPSTGKNLKPGLAIEWLHIGDKMAQKYVLCLDEKEIQYIREPSKHDAYQVIIIGVEPGKKHTVQIIARLNNGKETLRSKPITFTVPDKNDEQKIEVKDVSEEPDIDTLQANVVENKGNQKAQEAINQPQNKPPERPQSSKSQTKQQQISDQMYTIRSCGCQEPHKTFPGIEHYLNIIDNKPSPPSFIQRKPTYDNEVDEDNKKEDDDDDHVVIPNTSHK